MVCWPFSMCFSEDVEPAEPVPDLEKQSYTSKPVSGRSGLKGFIDEVSRMSVRSWVITILGFLIVILLGCTAVYIAKSDKAEVVPPQQNQTPDPGQTAKQSQNQVPPFQNQGFLPPKQGPQPQTQVDKKLKDILTIKPSTADEFVTMPHHNPVEWKVIEAALKTPIKDVAQFKAFMVQISPQYNTDGFAAFLKSNTADKTVSIFFSRTLPFIRHVVKHLPVRDMFKPGMLKVLRTNKADSVSLTSGQCLVILATSFLGLLKSPDVRKFPDPNIAGLFKFAGLEYIDAKYRSILHYFQTVRDRGDYSYLDTRKVTVYRHVLTKSYIDQFLPDKAAELGGDTRMLAVNVHETGTIEDEGAGMLEADFANKFVGGGALGGGNVQEEIRFMINPECIVSMLFCEVMQYHESIVIVGTERFSNYKGYGKHFRWDGNHMDQAKPVDDHLDTVIVAFDATRFDGANSVISNQLTKANLTRDLIKAFAGFSFPNVHKDYIATGNWGCGIFEGYIPVKAVIQYIAASLSGRKMLYFSFGDKNAVGLQKLFAKLQGRPVAQVWQAVLELSAYAGEKISKEDAMELVNRVVAQEIDA
eukprot:173550_1